MGLNFNQLIINIYFIESDQKFCLKVTKAKGSDIDEFNKSLDIDLKNDVNISNGLSKAVKTVKKRSYSKLKTNMSTDFTHNYKQRKRPTRWHTEGNLFNNYSYRLYWK